MGFSLSASQAKPLLQPYAGGEGTRRYYQDAAIRAVFEKCARCALAAEPQRALPTKTQRDSTWSLGALVVKNGINGKKLATQQSVDQAVKAICDIMRRGNCAGALQYVPELTWILFLRILDEREEREQHEAEALGVPFRPSLAHPYRWQDWAAPTGEKRKELQEGAP
ncbi:MAG: type I restriction-modification system subunit M N-terminal domain-containing protein [Candidatus Marinimicrobia bacterium]|nr:type I restriction-modification system subunit M N-terminal domain-containing protein [Candidatus Neomarinimicrobiota bacterium]